MAKRITRNEIVSSVESFVNSIYDNTPIEQIDLDHKMSDSSWARATIDQWCEGVYKDLASWKNDCNGTMWESNENRFDGKVETLERIRPIVVKRLKELKKEGYIIKAL